MKINSRNILLLLSIVSFALAQNMTNSTTNTTTTTIDSQDSGTRVLTVGYGTFTIILGIIISLLITFFVGRSRTYPEIVFFLTLIIPLVLFLFFYLAPKKADQKILEQQDFTTNPQLILQVFALVIACVSATMVGICVLVIIFFRGSKSIRISSQLEMERDKQRGEREKEREKKIEKADKNII